MAVSESKFLLIGPTPTPVKEMPANIYTIVDISTTVMVDLGTSLRGFYASAIKVVDVSNGVYPKNVSAAPSNMPAILSSIDNCASV